MDDQRKTCPECRELGRRQHLMPYQINFTEAIELCEYPMCTYPLGRSSFQIIERDFMDIPLRQGNFEKKKQAFLFLTNKSENVSHNEGITEEILDHDPFTNNEDDSDIINSDLGPKDWNDEVDTFLSSGDEGKESRCNDRSTSKPDESSLNSSKEQTETSSTAVASYVPLMNIPIEILPEVPQEGALQFSPCEVVQLTPPQQQQPNVCEISIDKDSKKITITIPGDNPDGTPSFETAIYSSSSPVIRGRGGYGYTRRRSGGSRMFGVARENFVASDLDPTTGSVVISEPDFCGASSETSERGGFETLRRPLRGRGSRGPRGSRRGNRLPKIEPNDPAAPVPPVVKKKRGRPSYKNIGYARLYESMIKTVMSESDKLEGDAAHQEVVTEPILENEMPCPDNVISELATVTELEVAVAQDVVNQALANLQGNKVQVDQDPAKAQMTTEDSSDKSESTDIISVENLSGGIQNDESTDIISVENLSGGIQNDKLSPPESEATVQDLSGVVKIKRFRKKKNQVVESGLLEGMDSTEASNSKPEVVVKKRRCRKKKQVEDDELSKEEESLDAKPEQAAVKKKKQTKKQFEDKPSTSKGTSKTTKQSKITKKAKLSQVATSSGSDDDAPLVLLASVPNKDQVEGQEPSTGRYGLRNRASHPYYGSPTKTESNKPVTTKAKKMQKKSAKLSSTEDVDVEVQQDKPKIKEAKQINEHAENLALQKQQKTDDSQNVSESVKISGAFSTYACVVDLSKFRV